MNLTPDEFNALMQLLDRAPMSPAERLWTQSLAQRTVDAHNERQKAEREAKEAGMLNKNDPTRTER